MGFIFVPVGLEPEVRVWGARGALPVADAAGVLRPDSHLRFESDRYKNKSHSECIIHYGIYWCR